MKFNTADTNLTIYVDHLIIYTSDELQDMFVRYALGVTIYQ